MMKTQRGTREETGPPGMRTQRPAAARSACDVRIGPGCTGPAHVGRGGLIVLGLVFACSYATAAGIESSPKDAARSIAADAIVCLEIQRPDRVIDRFTDPRFQDYLKLAPQYKKLLSDPKLGELRKVVDVIAGQLDTTWDQALRALTGGGILAALEADPGQEPRLYVLITPRDNDLLERANQVLLKLARQDAKDKGKPEPVKTSDHRGVIVHALGGEARVAYGLVAGKLAISNSVKNLERLIDRSPLWRRRRRVPPIKAKGPFASLADRAEWKTIKEQARCRLARVGLRRSRSIASA